jgi:hypothetical protein
LATCRVLDSAKRQCPEKSLGYYRRTSVEFSSRTAPANHGKQWSPPGCVGLQSERYRRTINVQWTGQWSLSSRCGGSELTTLRRINTPNSSTPGTSQSENSATTTSFTATQEVTHRMAPRGSDPSGMVRTAVVAQVLAVFPPPVLMGQCGKLNFLRGHDLGTGFGPPATLSMWK